MPSVPEKCKSNSYVDDTKLSVSFHLQNKQGAIEDMNEDLLKVRNWCFNNLLLLNPKKTKLMVFGSRHKLAYLNEFSLSLLGKNIFPSETVKDLGVTLDPLLSYDEHIYCEKSRIFRHIPVSIWVGIKYIFRLILRVGIWYGIS